jgi:8-oxo-dGTP pyrophosphatase MutT (NUDIX family)
MGDPPPWEVIESEHLHDCRVFRLRRSLVRSPHSGQVHPFFQIDSGDWVNVVPLTAAGEIVMVRQFRHGSRRVTLEIPGGLVDPGEAPAEAARRELLEETGHRCAAIEPLGVLNPNPALFSNRLHTFVARGAERVAAPVNDGTEHTVVELVPRAEIPERLRAGEIDHALVVAGLHWWLLAEGEAPR